MLQLNFPDSDFEIYAIYVQIKERKTGCKQEFVQAQICSRIMSSVSPETQSPHRYIYNTKKYYLQK